MSTSGYNLISTKTSGQFETMTGSAGDDAFSGSDATQVFKTGLGNDVVFAGGGDDVVYADIGNDWFDGGSGTGTLSFFYVNYVGEPNADLRSEQDDQHEYLLRHQDDLRV